MEFLHNKKIGIWGLGITGKSLINYLKNIPCTLSVTDKKCLSEEEKTFLTAHQTSFTDDVSNFLASNDIIVPSSGVDLGPYQEYSQKFLSEVDLFSLLWKKPFIAITGSLGKTTVTTFISAALKEQHLSIAMGGNIGIPLLDLLPQQNTADYGVIELSSFQLEYAHTLQPTLSIITNLFPNHLDRHKTLENYGKAKSNILRYQTHAQYALLPFSMAPLIRTEVWAQQRPFNFFCDKKPAEHEYAFLKDCDTLFYRDHNCIVQETNNKTTILLDHPFPQTSYPVNWMLVYITLYLLQKELILPTQYAIPEHRFEYVGTYDTLSFYNDSKATVMESVHAATDKLAGKNIILLLGGLSKGVDRKPYIHALKEKVQTIICFGKEAPTLSAICMQVSIPHHACETLDHAVEYAIKYAPLNSIILLSPGGSSYDLFKDYQERGMYFKKLIKQHFYS